MLKKLPKRPMQVYLTGMSLFQDVDNVDPNYFIEPRPTVGEAKLVGAVAAGGDRTVTAQQ